MSEKQEAPKELPKDQQLENSIKLLDVAIWCVGKEPLSSDNVEALSQTHNFLKQIRANAEKDLKAIKETPAA